MADTPFVAKNGLVANGTFTANSTQFGITGSVTANTTTVVIGTATVNSSVYTGTANNTSFVGSVSAANVVSNTQLSSNLANYQTTAGLSANVATLSANNAAYLGGTAASGYQTTAGLSSNVATLTANNTAYVGSVTAANVVSNAQLSANLSAYQTNFGLASNVATLSSNNASYLGGTAASGYQTTAGLSANVAKLTANNSSYAFGKSEGALNVNSALSSNTASYMPSTNLGYVGPNGLVYPANTTVWSNYPIGFSGMFVTGYVANGTPENNYGYFTKIANRDTYGGWGGIWVNYAGVGMYYGTTQLDTSYATWVKLLDVNNYNSYAPTLTGTGASGTWNITANNASYLGGTVASGYQTVASLAAAVAPLAANNASYLGGTAASGYQTTAGLAANVAQLAANYASSSYWAAYANGAVFNADAYDISGTGGPAIRIDSGFYQTSNAQTSTGWPVTTGGWMHLLSTTYNNRSNYYAMQFSSSFYSNDLWYRSVNGNGSTAWSRIIHDGNYNIYAPTLTGTGASGTWNITANNASYLGGTAASGYQTTAGLSANVATLTANNSSYAYGKTEGNLNVNNALTANNSSYLGGTAAAGYQTTAGLSANVATLTSNNTSYVGTVSAANVVSNSQLSANLSNYLLLSGGSLTGTLTSSSSITANTNFTVDAANTSAVAQFVYTRGGATKWIQYIGGSDNNLRLRNSLTSTSVIIFGTDDSVSLGSGVSFTVPGTADFQGTLKNSGYSTTASAANMYIGASGQIYKSTSSLRYKTAVEDITEEEARKALNLRAVSFKQKKGNVPEGDDPNKRVIGIIAEEVDLVDDRLVNYIELNGKTVPDAVQYDRIPILMLKLMQMQQKQIEQLQAQVAELMSK